MRLSGEVFRSKAIERYRSGNVSSIEVHLFDGRPLWALWTLCFLSLTAVGYFALVTLPLRISCIAVQRGSLHVTGAAEWYLVIADGANSRLRPGQQVALTLERQFAISLTVSKAALRGANRRQVEQLVGRKLPGDSPANLNVWIAEGPLKDHPSPSAAAWIDARTANLIELSR